MTRRTVLSISVQAVGGVAIAAVALPAVGFAVAPLFEQENESWQAVGPTSDFTPDTYRAVVITAVQGLGEIGKTTAYIRQGNPEITNSPEAKAKGYPPETPDEYIAISTRCAHVGCPVRFVQASGNFICPCHGGVYGFVGERIGGPPVRPLDRFQTRDHQRAGRGRPPLQRDQQPRSGSRPRPWRVHRRDLGLHLSAAALGSAAAVGAMPLKLPEGLIPAPLRRPPPPGQSNGANGAGKNGGGASRGRQGGRAPMSSAGSTSAPAARASSPRCSTGRCPRAPTGSTRSARPPSSPSSSRR